MLYICTYKFEIMDAKLTIKLNKDVINKAKSYSSNQKRSLSRIIESYLNSLVNTTNLVLNDDIQISTFVKSISTGVHIPVDIDEKKVYSDHLLEKYK